MKFSNSIKSLKFKVFLISSIGIVIVTTLSTLLFSYYFVSESEKGLANKGASLARLLGGNLVSPLDFEAILGGSGQNEEGNTMLKAAVRDGGFTYAVVYRKDNSVFAQSGKIPSQIDNRFKKQHKTAGEINILNDEMVHARFLIKKGPQTLGTLFVGLSKKELEEGIANFVTYTVLVGVGMSAVFITVFFFVISSTTVKPILTITRLMKRLGGGDVRPLTNVTLGTNTTEIVEMYQALEYAITAMRENLHSIATVADELNKTADDILTNSANLSVAANEQATAVNETTVTIEEVEKTGHLTSENAKNIQSVADRTQKISNEGLSAVDITRAQLEDIQNQVVNIVQSANKLNMELEEVDRIIASVAGVTQQSHTLSINASIEAVKAGQKGRGFAVVANRIRDLSQQSREATEHVRGTLTGIQQAIGNMLTITEQGLSSVQRGVESMERTGEVIQRLGESIAHSTEAARSIAHNTFQQATGLEQTARAMNEINDSTHTNLSGIENLKRNGEELKDHAVAMKALVELFQISDN
ncbi:MAG: methyl-accepting chemotaxis protein [Deltaproteobacteria bacterium]|nr:methyl-accepting chemotaxis protein [Deltaproteobacteria bacterium]